MFHGDRARTGWDDTEPDLTPERVGGGAFRELWESPRFAAAVVGSTPYAPHLYASPLYADDVAIAAGPYAGARASVVFAATSNGDVFAVNAVGTSCGVAVPYGAILWSRRLAEPSLVADSTLPAGLDGGVVLGVMSTPVLDAAAGILYVVTQSGESAWLAFALDVRTGGVAAGWPVTLDQAAVTAVHAGGPPFSQSTSRQRAALALSPDGSRLYVTFGAMGWITAIATRGPRLVEAFPGGPELATEQAGMWAPGGAAIDASGALYQATGNSPVADQAAAGCWGESVLRFDASALALRATYTPFNRCALDVADADLGGSSPMLLDLDAGDASTTNLLVVGSKQGNVYLLDRDALPGPLDARPACSTDASSDGSLLPPEAQPQFGTRGPLNVFGPYSETYANVDYAKMRTTPALFRDAMGATFVFVSGASKAAANSTKSVPPSLVRLRVVTSPGAAPYLAVDAADRELALLNTGSPVVTSDHGEHPIAWILDENQGRFASVVSPESAHPVLYAVDGTTMRVLWRSSSDDLPVGGKYSTVAVAHGVVYVGTDRIEAFGVAEPP
jgi:hypothetical protein